MRTRCGFLVLAGLTLLIATAGAIEYPDATTLRCLTPELTLPENVEALKRAGVRSAEIDLVLANVLHWWDDVGPDLKWLAAEKVPAVRVCQQDMLRLRRRLWRDRLLGIVSEADGAEKKRAGLRAVHVRLAEILTAEELASYDLRATPESVKVFEWAHGLGLAEDTVLWLAEAEGERRRIHGRTFVHEGHGVTFASDAEAGDLVRIRTSMLALPVTTAAIYLSRADFVFYDWKVRHVDELGLTPEIALRLYVLRRSARLAALQLYEDRTVPVPQERQANARIYTETREKVAALLGAEPFARYRQHELGRWLAGEVRLN